MYLEVNDLCKSYGEGGSYTQVLKNVSLEVQQGDMCVIQGTSGSGKSTLLNCIGGLDTVDSGSIVVNGKELVGLNAKQLSDYRREELGFVFQFYDLVPDLTVQENIQVCQYLTRSPLDLGELLQVLGLTEHKNKFPAQLSGGQQQRCAIARALIKNPAILLCDEIRVMLEYLFAPRLHLRRIRHLVLKSDSCLLYIISVDACQSLRILSPRHADLDVFLHWISP